MPPVNPTDLTGVIAAIQALTTAVSSGVTDLAPLTAQVTRVADAAEASNVQIGSVIGTDTNGDDRVRTDPNTP